MSYSPEPDRYSPDITIRQDSESSIRLVSKKITFFKCCVSIILWSFSS